MISGIFWFQLLLEIIVGGGATPLLQRDREAEKLHGDLLVGHASNMEKVEQKALAKPEILIGKAQN